MLFIFFPLYQIQFNASLYRLTLTPILFLNQSMFEGNLFIMENEASCVVLNGMGTNERTEKKYAYPHSASFNNPLRIYISICTMKSGQNQTKLFCSLKAGQAMGVWSGKLNLVFF